MKKMKCVLLVDDSKSTNFYNKKLIEKTGFSDCVYEAMNGLEALEYIEKQGTKREEGGTYEMPDVIFLDINMPKMNGFEFLENFMRIDKEKRANTLIVFLTTSNWQKDRLKAFENGIIYDFYEKPLQLSAIEKIRKYYDKVYPSIFLKQQNKETA